MPRFVWTALLGLLMVAGCRSAYYSTWEKFGYEKRDLLAGEVEDARKEQVKARDQFKSALARFQELTGFKGGELEQKYNQLKSEYERCSDRASALSKQIDDVDGVAKDMFAEWKQELSQYGSADLRRQSESKMRESQERYGQLMAAMRKSEDKMQPVLKAFADQVLFLKHNLNAAAIASLQGTSMQIDTDVAALVEQMNQSIAESEKFINTLKPGTNQAR